jgi:hypothetical protein
MTSNPLIDKYHELYGKKEEPQPDYYKGEKSYAEELKELRDTSTIPITKFTTHDIDSINDSFLQIAEKIENKEAQVCTMNMEIDQQTRTQRITFEVLTNF